MIWLLVLVSLWPLFWLIRMAVVVRALLGLEFCRAQVRAMAVTALPRHFQEAAAPWVAQLEALGFTPMGGWQLNTTSNAAFDEYALVLGRGSQPVRAVISSYGESTRSGECWASLRTTKEDGTEIVTASHGPEELLPVPPGLVSEIIEGCSPLELVQRHLARVGGGAGGTWICPDIAHAARREREIRDAVLGSAHADRQVVEAVPGIFRLRFRAAVQRAQAAVRRAAQLKKLQPSAQRSVIATLSSEAQAEFDLQQYRQQGALLRGKFSLKAKAMISAGSFVLFAAVLAWQYSVVVAAALVVALIIHECGHLAGMRWFGFRDTQLLFIPFFGGAAIGHDDRILAPWQHIVIILLGPLPGIFLGLALLVYAGGGHAPAWVDEVAYTMLVLNAFNLLPVLPLDGGQIVDYAVASRFPRARVLFLGGSALGMILIGQLGGGARILFGLGVASLIRLPVEWRLAGLRRNVREDFPEGGPEEPVVRRILHELREPQWAKVAVGQRLQLARGLQRILCMPRPRLGTMIFAVVTFTAPFWLGTPFALWAMARQGEARVQQAYARAAAAGVTAARPKVAVVAVPEESNGALLYAQAVALADQHPEAEDTADPDTASQSKKIILLLRAAAQKPAFVPSAKARAAGDKPTLANWNRTALVRRLAQAGQERLHYHEAEAAVEYAIDDLKLLRLMQTAPGYMGWSEYSYLADSAWSLVEEAMAAGAKLPAKARSELQALAASGPDVAFAAATLPRSLLSPVRDDEEIDAALAGSRWMRVFELLQSVSPTLTQARIDAIDDAVTTHRRMQEIAAGHWPDPAPGESAGEARSSSYQIGQFGDFIARLRLASVALRLAASPLPADGLPGLATLGVPATELQHPATREAMRLTRRGRLYLLSFGATASKPAEEEEESDEVKLVWRVAATGT